MRMRWPGVLVAGVLAGLIIGCAGPSRGEGNSPRAISRTAAAPLRVMTFNIHHAAGLDEKIDIERIAGVIKDQHPDLVAIQEVDRGTRRVGGADQPAELARLTGLNMHFSPAFDLMGGQYGQVILSRDPIEDVTTLKLPRLKDEQRIAIVAQIARPGQALRFVATHLTHNSEPERVGQVTELLKQLQADDSPPTILAGDLNSTPGSAPIRLLLESFTDTTGPDALSHPAEAPRIKIDWILLSRQSPWRAGKVTVIDNTVASDHRPVVVDLVEREHP